MKIVRDPIHGDCEFSHDEWAVIDSRAFQRLRGIHQLGPAYLVYPGARHSRFEHSLGTCHLTGRLIDRWIREGARQWVELRPLLRLYALLHDLTHVPFGHTFEDERRLFARHDERADRWRFHLHDADLRAALVHMGCWQEWLDLPQERQRGRLPRGRSWDLVDGALGADLLDYLQRDSYFCGLRVGYDERVLRSLEHRDGQMVYRLTRNGIFRNDALSELLHLLRSRYMLTERVYFHHTKVAAGAMLSKALELALEDDGLGEEDLWSMEDQNLIDRLEKQGQRSKPIARIMDDWRRRRIYRRAYMLAPDQGGGIGLSGAAIGDLVNRYHRNREGARGLREKEIAHALRIDEGDVIVYCPALTMQAKDEAIPVLANRGEEPGPLFGFGLQGVKEIADQHRRIWRFYVFITRRYEKMAAAGSLCEELFGHPNQLL